MATRLLRLRAPLARGGAVGRAVAPVAPAWARRDASDAAASLSEARFHDLADAAIDRIEESLEVLEDCAIDDFDVINAQGVLTVCLGSRGTWVINKQTPNRQIWWSSPLSGPKRYEWVGEEWLSTREREPLHALLKAEVEGLFEGVVLELD